MEPSLTNYIRFFKSMPYFLKTANGLFISHAGPSKDILSINDFNEMCGDDHSSKELYGFLWNRYGGYSGYTSSASFIIGVITLSKYSKKSSNCDFILFSNSDISNLAKEIPGDFIIIS